MLVLGPGSYFIREQIKTLLSFIGLLPLLRKLNAMQIHMLSMIIYIFKTDCTCVTFIVKLTLQALKAKVIRI